MKAALIALGILLLLGQNGCKQQFTETNEPKSITERTTEQFGQDINYMVGFNGECESLQFKARNFSDICTNKMLHFTTKSGRSVFDFILASGGVIAFSGGKDRQPELNYYVLELDQVYQRDKDSNGLEISSNNPVSGECILRGDPLTQATIICNAHNDVGFTASGRFQTTRSENMWQR